MKRPMLITLIGYLIGIIWELYFKISIAPFIIIFVIVIICMDTTKYMSKKPIICRGTGYRARKIKYILKKPMTCRGTGHRARKTIIILIISSIISNSIIIYQENKYQEIYKLNSNEYRYIATVISNKEEKEFKQQYKIKIENIYGVDKYKGIELILNIPNNYDIELKYGDKIEFEGIYIAPEVQRNYKGFDYSKYLKTVNIYGTVKCSNSKVKILKSNNLSQISIIANKIRSSIEDNIRLILKNREADLLIGILLGDNSNINENIKEDFRNSGIYHILAVSGAHMSYVILGITFLVDKINISKRKKEVLKIIGIIFFMLISSISVSVLRAGIMGIITICAELFYRKKDTINTICISMLILLIYNPYCINSISFQLSYGGVIGIVLCNDFYLDLLERIKINKSLSKIIAVILSAQTVILPIMIINYHTISLVFLFSNIIISYLIGITIILGFICVFLSFILLSVSKLLGIPLDFLLKILINIASFFGNLPVSKIYVIAPSIISIILYYLMISLIKTSFKKLKKVLIVLLVMNIIMNNYIHVPKYLDMFFIDVGQGDSTLIITPESRNILIDGGGVNSSYSNTYNVGQKILLPYLLNRGVKKLDYIIISHFDSDHCRRDYICDARNRG